MVEGEMERDQRVDPPDAKPLSPNPPDDAEQQVLTSSSANPDEPAEEADERRAFKIIHPSRRSPRKRRFRSRRREGDDSGVRVKALPLLGAVLGLASFALPWDALPAIHRETFHRLGDYVYYYPSDYSLVFALAAALVLIGSILLFVTSFGGLIQLSGILLFVTGIPGGQYTSLEIGFVVCLVGAVFGCASIVLRTPLAVPGRFLTFLPGSRDRRELRVSLTALGCFALGTAAVFMAWYLQQFSWNYNWVLPRPDYDSAYSLLNLATWSDPVLVTGASVFIIGSLISLLSPLGSVAQGAGVIAIFVGIQPELMEIGSSYGGYTLSTSLGPGMIAGIAAVALGVISIFFPLRIRLPTRSLSVSLQGPQEIKPKGMADTISDALSTAKSSLPRAMPSLLVLLILLSSAVCAAALAYTQKWSSVSVWVDIWVEPGEEVEVAIQVDGEEILRDTLLSSTTCIATSQVAAGTHEISVDYCCLSVDPDGVDGVPDWRSYCSVRPFKETRVSVMIGGPNEVRSVDLECTPTEDGAKVVFGAITWSGLWPMSLYWSHVTLTLTDGESFVSWSPLAADLDGGGVTVKDYGNRSLGEADVSCVVTDLSGNGDVNNGDFVEFAAVNGTLFLPDITYSLLVVDESRSGLIGECELVFE